MHIEQLDDWITERQEFMKSYYCKEKIKITNIEKIYKQISNQVHHYNN